MRYVVSATAAVIAFMVLAPSIALGQNGLKDLSIANYQFVNEQRVTRTQFYVTYHADLVNRGLTPMTATATVTSLVATVEVVAGQGTLHFPVVPAGGQVTSLDTFTLLVDRSVPFDIASLVWTFLNPVANAGPNQTTQVGKTVTLDGSGSSNPSGVGTLTYKWVFTSRPSASSAALSGSSGVLTSFVVDVPGTYVVTLTVSNGAAADSTTVTISTVNSPPVANAGPNQTVAVGALVTLNGSGSSDVDGDPLTYFWSLIAEPAGSSAELSSARNPSPTFVADKAGSYVAQLVVNDGTVNSAPATVRITTANTPPVANAGPNQTVTVGTLVQLNGSGSTDVDGDPLTFRWSFNSVPSGSTASLSSVSAVNPTFTADRAGTYVAQLIVNDGTVDSQPSTVTVTTSALQAPVANPGPNQTVVHGVIVTLSGSGTDPQGLPLTLTWSLITRPPNSLATLSSISAPHPTFLADQPGTYVAQLIVSNGFLNSQPATVVITTTNTPPVAVAGVNQGVAVGVMVFLDGSASWDADNDPLTYSWSLTSRPASSTATLQGAVTRTPSFLADMPGTYVAQLIVNDGFTNSNPSTVTITASTQKVTLTPNPLNLQSSAKTLAVTLSTAAGTGGVVVTLSGFDPSVISVPATVTVPQNGTVATVMVTPLSSGSTNILATAPGYQPGTTAVTVATPTITVTLSSTAVGLTHSINGTITLNEPADTGASIALSSNPAGRVTFDTANVAIPAGGTTGTFKVIGGTLGAATVTAAAGGYVSGTAAILVVNLGGIALPTGLSVAPGQSTALSVTLSTPAPTDGVTVALASSDPSILGVSPSVFIAPGATTPSTPAQVTGVAFGSALVTATAGGYAGDSQTVKVSATLSFSTQAVVVGAAGDQSVNLILSAPAPIGGLPITLQSSNTAVVTAPPSVVIAAGSTTSPSFLVHGVAGGSATITASTTVPNVASATLPVTVLIYGSIGLPSGVTVAFGQSVPFPITLSAPAPAGGATVTLSTSNSGTVDISPKQVTILAGLTQPATQPQVTGNGIGQATITAAAPGYGFASQSVTGNTTLSFVPASLAISGVETKDFTLTLPVAAPTGGVTVNLTASPTGIVTVPATVVIAQGATTATVHVTGVAPGTTTVTAAATSPNIGNATGSVTVQNVGAISLPANVTVAPGQTLPFAVTLSSAAPAGGVTIALSSSDSTKVSITPPSVSIAAGSLIPTTQPQVTGGDFGSATISASAPGFAAASQNVKVGAALSFTPPDNTIVGTNTKDVTLTLSAPAPSAVSVSLSASPNGVVTVPATATIAKDATTATVTLKGVSVGTATITASSSAPNVSSATGTITVQSAGAIGLPPNATVALGQSTPFPVTLPGAAPQGGVTVTLTSDSAKVGISPGTVTIDAGQTQPAVQPQVTGNSPGSANITASAPAYTSTTKAVQVTATISFTPSSLSLSGTQTKNLTLTLSGPAPSGGLAFTVSSNNTSVATVGSATATIQGGGTTTTIAVSAVAAGSTVIRASAPNLTDATATVTVILADIIVPASVSVSPGESVIYPISLANPAASLMFLNLTSSDPTKATLSQSSITIPVGQTVSSNQVRIIGVATGATTVKVTSANGTLADATTAVTVGYTLSIVPASLTIVGNGNFATLNLTLSGPAPAGGIDLTLTSSNPSVASVPPSVTLSATSTSAGARVMSVGVGTTVIHVSGPNVPEATATVTVAPPGSVSLSGPATIGLSQTGTLTVTLSTPATGSGLSVDLTSSDPTKVSVSPSTVTIPAGSMTPVTQPQLAAVNVGNVTISAVAQGFTSSAPLPVTVNATITWISQNTTIAGIGNQVLLQLRLNATAPMAGLTVNMTSSNSSVATVQGTSNFIWDGSTSPGILIPVTSVGFGTTTIHASGTNIPDVTTTVTVSGPLGITTTSLPNGIVGRAYNATVAASGGTQPYNWTVTGLPAGLAINASTGAITGTPAAAGAATVNVTVTDGASPTHLSASKTFPVTVVAGIGISTTSLPNGVVGTAYTGTVAATGGTTPYAWTATGLPAGLSINPNTGAITGTPTAAGAASIVVTVTDATSPTHLSVSKTFPVTIVVQPTITTSSLPNGVVSSAYNSGPLAATGGTTPYAWTATGLPAGLSIDAGTGAITGTPTVTGPASIVVTVTDSFSPTHLSASKTFPIVIYAGLTITTNSLPNGVVGTAYTGVTVVAAGGTTPYAWTATGLPAGLSIDPNTGAITGTPTVGGPASIVVTVTDATSPTHLSVSKPFPVTIVVPPAITTSSLPNGVVNYAYNSGPLAATGGTTPYAWTATGLPAGLSIDPNTGAITGTPTVAGAASIVVTVTDSLSPTHLSASKTFPVTVVAGIGISTTSLPNGVVGTAYTGTVAATGGTTPYAWTATGLPAGLSINPNTGAITGTPTAAGAASIVVTVTDATSPTHLSANKTFPVTIVAALAITTAALPNGVAAAPYSFTVLASGGNPSYTWAATGLPAGLNIDPATGAITGTTSVTGTSTVTVTVTDTTSPTHLSVSQPFPLIIMPPLQNTTLSLADGVVGSVYNQPLSAFGGTTPYSWTATGLPGGLSVDSANSAIKGTPTANGTFTVSVTVTDATSPTNLSSTKNLQLIIRPALALTTTSPLPGGVVGSSYNAATLAATGGTPPYVWSQTGLPAGLNLDPSSGAITGTPTAAGTGTPNITVTDATLPVHQSVTKPFSITIAAHVAITTTSLPNGKQGTLYAGSIVATGGTPLYTWSATGLPAGLGIDSSSGAVTGTPNVQGAFTMTVTVTDSTTPTHQTDSKLIPITIDPGTLIITTPSPLPGGQAGAAYNQTLGITGGTTPFHWSATGLPSGLTLNASTGQITGSPTLGGTSSVNFTVTDSGNPVQTATKTLSITIQSLIITTAALPQATAGVQYSYQLTASGGAGQLTWSVNALPRGMALDPLTGILSGAPNNPSANPYTFTVTDSSTPPQTATKDLLLTVKPVPVVITTTSLPAGVVNAAYSTTLSATGGTLPYTWSTTTVLPPGLVFSSAGVLSGTPTAYGTTSVTITVTDGATTPQVVSTTLQLAIGFQNGSGSITVSNATVGANLQVPITITFTPALPINETVTISSGNGSLVTLGSGAVVGNPTIQSGLSAGTTSIGTFVKALGSSGQVTITVSVPGYSNGTGTVTLANSGFVVAGPNGIGAAFSTYQGVSTTLTVSAARLDSSGLMVETEQLRGGFTVNVPIISTVTTIGTVSSGTVPMSGGSDNATTQFTAGTTNTGVTNVSVGPVPPVSLFTQPSAGASLTVTVGAGGLVPFTGTIGKNLQKVVSVGRLGSTLNSAVVTVHSQDATKLKFSATTTGATSDTIQVTIPSGQSTTPDFYADAFDSSGPVAYTVSSPAYGSMDATVALAPSGFSVTAPSTMTVSPPNATVTVSTAWLDGTGSPAELQAVASGVSISVAVASNNSSVGNVTVSPITIGSGSFGATTEFQAVGTGTAQITASAGGYGSGSVSITVTGSGNLIVCGDLTIGQFLQDSCYALLPGGTAPSGGVHVTVQSNSPLVTFSTTATGAGSASIGFDIPAGGNIAYFYVQSLGSSGSASYTATAPGYGSGTANVTMMPSGVVILGPNFSPGPINVGVSGPPPVLTVYTAQLSASNSPATPQSLAGGAPLTVSLTNFPGKAGTVPATVIITPGTSSSDVLFTPSAVGSTTVSVVQPGGWTLPTTWTSIGINVN